MDQTFLASNWIDFGPQVPKMLIQNRFKATTANMKVQFSNVLYSDPHCVIKTKSRTVLNQLIFYIFPTGSEMLLPWSPLFWPWCPPTDTSKPVTCASSRGARAGPLPVRACLAIVPDVNKLFMSRVRKVPDFCAKKPEIIWTMSDIVDTASIIIREL